MFQIVFQNTGMFYYCVYTKISNTLFFIHTELNPAFVSPSLKICLSVNVYFFFCLSICLPASLRVNKYVFNIFIKTSAYLADCHYLIYSWLNEYKIHLLKGLEVLEDWQLSSVSYGKYTNWKFQCMFKLFLNVQLCFRPVLVSLSSSCKEDATAYFSPWGE